MDIVDIITQLDEGANNRDYNYHCCDCSFDSLYEFRKHIFENHQDEYLRLEPYFHREKPKEMTKEERRASTRKALKKKELAKKGKRVRVKEDYSKQPTAWIIYNHNGAKIK